MKKQGHYSVIQYSEYPERIEFVNAGIVLFANDPLRVIVRFGHPQKRIQKMFGVRVDSHFDLACLSLENRIKQDFSRSWDEESINRFISMRANKFRMAPLRSVLVENAEEIADQLLSQLVTSDRVRPRAERVQAKLKRKFEVEGVLPLLDKPEPVPLPQGVVVNAPFAYQNGSYNLVNAVSLSGTPDAALERASKLAVEGQWLFESESRAKKLVVVGDLNNQQDNFVNAIELAFAKHDVKFYRMDRISELISDIKKNASISP